MVSRIHRLAIFAFLCSIVSCTAARADVVTITDSTASGFQQVVSNTQFTGVLTNVSPTEISGQPVDFNDVPAGESFAVGDVVGRAVRARRGTRRWSYSVNLPGDAVAGTGLSAINFSGRAFERGTDNLEFNDRLVWELYLNNDTNPVATTGPAAGSDWTSFLIALNDSGGSTVTHARVAVSITGFSESSEWFAFNGTLSANYVAIPEPSLYIVAGCVLLAFAMTLGWKRRSSS